MKPRKRGPELNGVDLPLTAQQRAIANTWRFACIPLAREAEKRYRLPRGELFAEAWSAMCRAAAGFDESRGFTFSTYAFVAVRRVVDRAGKRIRDDREARPTTFEVMDHDIQTHPPDTPTEIGDIVEMLADCTPREVLAVQMRAEGMDDKAIAAELGVCRQKLEKMMERVKAKVRVRLNGD